MNKKRIIVLTAILAILSTLLIVVLFIIDGQNKTVEKINDEDEFILVIPSWMEFGMKEGAVRKHYDDKPITGDSIILYLNQEHDKPYKDYNSIDYEYSTCYGFTSDNKLVYLSYDVNFDPVFGLEKTENKPYVYEYDFMREAISEKYGEPLVSEDFWINDKYKDDPDMINYAVENGDYIRIALWRFDDLYVSILLNKDIKINYTTKKDEWFYLEGYHPSID